ATAGTRLAARDALTPPASGDERAEVNGRGLAIQDAEIAGQVVESGHFFGVEHRRKGMEAPRVWVTDAREARLTGELGRDPLHDLARDTAVAEHPILRLAEHVDESGRNDQAGGVDPARRPRALSRTDRS